MSETRRLFTPVKLGRSQLQHRVAMAPLTRMRAIKHVPVERHAVYYGQRASKGGLIITEATFISAEAGGYPNAPGIYSQEMIDGWKGVTKAVHDKGGVIYLQLWALGRANGGDADVSRVVSASTLAFEGGATPEPLTVEEIQQYVQNYAQAAKNAIEAGFDGVEIHSANGYLLQQFINPDSNTRTDEFGGSLENRTRFVKQAIKAVTDAIGQDRTGIRFSPWTSFQGMGKGDSENIYTDYVHLVEHIRDSYPKFSYIHMTEDNEVWRGQEIVKPRSNDRFRAVLRKPLQESEHEAPFAPGYPEPDEDSSIVFVSCGDYRTESSIKLSQAKGDVVAIGRSFISNPDLPERIRKGLEWTPYDRSTFYYGGGDQIEEGYTDYATAGNVGHGEIAAKRKAEQEAQKAKV